MLVTASRIHAPCLFDSLRTRRKSLIGGALTRGLPCPWLRAPCPSTRLEFSASNLQSTFNNRRPDAIWSQRKTQFEFFVDFFALCVAASFNVHRRSAHRLRNGHGVAIQNFGSRFSRNARAPSSGSPAAKSRRKEASSRASPALPRADARRRSRAAVNDATDIDFGRGNGSYQRGRYPWRHRASRRRRPTDHPPRADPGRGPPDPRAPEPRSLHRKVGLRSPPTADWRSDADRRDPNTERHPTPVTRARRPHPQPSPHGSWSTAPGSTREEARRHLPPERRQRNTRFRASRRSERQPARQHPLCGSNRSVSFAKSTRARLMISLWIPASSLNTLPATPSFRQSWAT